MYCIVVYCIVLYFTVLYCILMYCAVLYHIVLCCTVLFLCAVGPPLGSFFCYPPVPQGAPHFWIAGSTMFGFEKGAARACVGEGRCARFGWKPLSCLGSSTARGFYSDGIFSRVNSVSSPAGELRCTA